jgi:hypothetical protein
MEAMLGMSLYSYPYLKQNAVSLLLLLMSSLQQNWKKGQNRFYLEACGVEGESRGQGVEMAQTIYVHMNK